MISHNNKFIYTRIAKTASSTIIQLMEHYVDDMKTLVDENWTHDPNHIPLYFLKKNIKEEHFNSYFKFGFVRNPWDRMVSAYAYTLNWYLKKDPSSPWCPTDFKSWIVNLDKNDKYRYPRQHKFVEGCDFVGRFENLQEDFNIICDKIGIPQQQLPHKNKSKHKHYTEYYDDETRELVAKQYAKDIEYFKYEFGE